MAAKRQKEIWRAAVPLARVWEATRDASRLRQPFAGKLKEFTPDLEKLTEAATRFANALDHDVATARSAEDVHRSEATRFREKAAKAREEAATAGEHAAKDETLLQQSDQQLEKVQQEEQSCASKERFRQGRRR